MGEDIRVISHKNVKEKGSQGDGGEGCAVMRLVYEPSK